METQLGHLDQVIGQLRAHGAELSRVEAKLAAGGCPKSLLETISAFANTDGGLILLGLDEATNFAAKQGINAKALRDAAVDQVTNKVSPPPDATVDITTVDGSPIVVVDVAPLPPGQGPCFVISKGMNNGSYRRVGDADVHMGTYEIFLRSTALVQRQDDREPVSNARETDLDIGLVDRYLATLSLRDHPALRGSPGRETVLRRLNILVDTQRGPAPTLGGLLALGTYPQQHFPQLFIAVSSYPSSSKDAVTGPLKLLDRLDAEGPIPDMIDSAVRAVLRNLRKEIRSQGVGAVEVPEIPVDVLREAIANAVTHRDYSPLARGEQVLVEIYPDRVEVISPGGLHGGRTVEDLDDWISRSRNESLSRILTAAPFRDRDQVVCENVGSGIPRMQGELRAHGMPPAEFRDRHTSFTVTLARHGLLDQEIQSQLSALGMDGLVQDVRLVGALALAGHELSVVNVRRLLGRDSDEVRSLLETMRREAWLDRLPGQRDRYEPGRRLRLRKDQPMLPIVLRATKPGIDLPQQSERVLLALSATVPTGIHELAEATGLAVKTLRGVLHALVEHGLVTPTAAAQSRNRKYLLSAPQEI